MWGTHAASTAMELYVPHDAGTVHEVSWTTTSRRRRRTSGWCWEIVIGNVDMAGGSTGDGVFEVDSPGGVDVLIMPRRAVETGVFQIPPRGVHVGDVRVSLAVHGDARVIPALWATRIGPEECQSCHWLRSRDVIEVVGVGGPRTRCRKAPALSMARPEADPALVFEEIMIGDTTRGAQHRRT